MSGTISKALIFLLLFVPLAVGADHCFVSQIAVLPGTWENSQNKTSLTLQAQDSAGASCHVSQTLRFAISSNGAGSFTGQSGGNLQMFISSGTANRNFYYDGHPESYILNITAGYGAADAWTPSLSASFSPSGSSGTQGSTSTSTSAEAESGSSSSSSNSSGSSGGGGAVTYSVHYSSSALSAPLVEERLVMSAGLESVRTREPEHGGARRGRAKI